MYSYFFDPPYPNFQLSFVKVGTSVIPAVLIIPTLSIIKKVLFFFLPKSIRGGVRGDMIMITDYFVLHLLLENALPFTVLL